MWKQNEKLRAGVLLHQDNVRVHTAQVVETDWLGLFVLWHINLRDLFNVKAIHEEEHRW